MFALTLAVMAAAWLVKAEDDNTSYNTHGVVAFIRSGETTPLIAPGTRRLSALGAQQMYKLGQQFRGRYINTDQENNGLGHEPIQGLAPDILDPSQLLIQTLDTNYLMTSAQAFMQGLYPPYSLNRTRVGPVADATGILSNNTAIDFPMGGYQYAPIQVLSELDPQSIYLAGDQNCPASQQESLMYQTTDAYLETKALSQSFYQALNRSLFDNLIRQSDM
jgi:hypothetical protein